MSDPAIDAFTAAHADLRIRGAFRLLGVLLTVALVLPLTIDTLEVFHEGVYLIYPGPFAACWALGELAIAFRSALRRRPPRRHAPPIAVARVVVRVRASAASR